MPTFFFAATDPAHGTELWRSDGTAAGTSLVLDILPGSGSSSPTIVADIGGGEVLFVAKDEAHGRELWVTDGTATGTHLLLDIYPQYPWQPPQPINSSVPAGFASLGDGRYVFSAADGVHGNELWITDGTNVGTHILHDIAQDPGTQTVWQSSYPEVFASVGNRVIFSTPTDDFFVRMMWSTDGTPEGLQYLGALRPETGVHIPGGDLLFAAGTAGLWRTDGTSAGTVRIDANTAEELFLLNDGRAAFGDFYGQDFRVTDGTAVGTQLLGPLPDGLLAVTAGRSVWVVDATESGVNSFERLNALGSAEASGRIVFITQSSEGWGMYATDGTKAGVEFLGIYFPTSYTTLSDGRLLFSTYDKVNGDRTIITDGTPAGTIVIKDIFDGGITADYATEAENLVVNLSNEEADGPLGGSFGHQVLPAIVNVLSGSGDDYILGSATGNYLAGGGGDDSIYGGRGVDFLHGGDGNDTLVGRENFFNFEIDTLYGDAGDDKILGSSGDYIFGGTGYDLLYAVNSISWDIDLGGTSIEWFQAAFGNDVITAASQTQAVTVIASGGDDAVTGSPFDDVVWGGVGHDVLVGGDGNDVLVGDVGSDSIHGNDGDDRLYVDSNDIAVFGDNGYDTVYIIGGAGIVLDMGIAQVEWAGDYAGGADTIDGTSAIGDVSVFGGANNDTVRGGSGGDFLWGEAGNDRLSGGVGDDSLVGGVGADVLKGGAGVDAIFASSGGGGDGSADVVVYDAAGWGTDFVFDFEIGLDKLDLRGLGLDPTAITITDVGGQAWLRVGGTDLVVVAGQGATLSLDDLLL